MQRRPPLTRRAGLCPRSVPSLIFSFLHAVNAFEIYFGAYKAGDDIDRHRCQQQPRSEGAELEVTDEFEKALHMEIAQFAAVMDSAATELAPHKICGYIYEDDELPPDFTCPICKAPASRFKPL